MKKIYSPHLKLAQEYWRSHLKATDLAIDATCGNGHDTLFLSQLCRVYSLDIQPQALQNTRALLAQTGADASLHLLSHESIDTLPLPAPPRLIVYNLGYLPKSDKSITTLTPTTLISVEKSLSLLSPGGALSITCYPGHAEGAREQAALETWLQGKPNALHQKWSPQAPSFIWVIKS